ncbi:hypothetical protein TrVE_jg5659 [Triparma verrucosa]|uniref:C2H2-type domain-containing protein n=1 Tax=Triparma verrucosa TaxID=1606542 RepID=A0A9W7KYJ8_9STRA|nr:hypothetical protein TrVE_jg5659 [Triparma verrucosa]
MGKHEKGSAKDIANRAKAKGLQKLQFYCQMCQKQCRDANGFKCHQTSASHLRMMSILRENTGKIIDDFSEEFEKSYVDTLRRHHGVKRVNANNVYQEVIQDKHHIHMNATQWASLTVFIQYLGKKGICIVEQDERGWFVQYIERDVNSLKRAEKANERARAEKVEEEKATRRMEKQIIAAAKAQGAREVEATTMVRGEGESIKLSLGKGGLGGGLGGGVKRKLEEVKLAVGGSGEAGGAVEPAKKSSKPLSAVEQIMLENENKKKREQEEKEAVERRKREEEERAEQLRKEEKKKKGKRKDYWLRKDIVVKIKNKELADGKFYKKKGVVETVVEKYGAEVRVKDTVDVIILDQDDLETVVGPVGGQVMIVNGYGRGEEAELVEIKTEDYCANLKILETGELVKNVEYEDFSKMA